MKHYKSIDEAIEDFYHNNCINPDKYLSVEKDAYSICCVILPYHHILLLNFQYLE